MDSLKVKELGPIYEADVQFGDLTLLVGPQASGKSIFLQLVKLLLDKNNIRKTLEQYGFIWGNTENTILDRYFGEGMSGIWNENTEIKLDGKNYPKSNLLPKRGAPNKDIEEKIFYIPAQRIVCLNNGWPKYFSEYDDSVPYVLKHFGETLRQLLENNSSSKDEPIFPQSQRLKAPLRASFNNSIFHDGQIILDKSSGKKRFKLNINNTSIPFMSWSAGQKEFMPLLLSFYWLCPPSKASRKDDIKYVILEEPEMGLHPQAIESVILQVIDLLSRDYKVIISTHSPVFLEFAWAFKYLQQSKSKTSEDSLYKIFNIKKTAASNNLFKDILKNKKIKTYYFERNLSKVRVKDISSLDASNDDTSISEWGGLATFSTKASNIIAETVAHED